MANAANRWLIGCFKCRLHNVISRHGTFAVCRVQGPRGLAKVQDFRPELKRHTATCTADQTTKRKGKRHMTTFDSFKLQNFAQKPAFFRQSVMARESHKPWPSWGQNCLSSLPLTFAIRQMHELFITFSSPPPSVMHA